MGEETASMYMKILGTMAQPFDLASPVKKR
jgi:hypothetical protein